MAVVAVDDVVDVAEEETDPRQEDHLARCRNLFSQLQSAQEQQKLKVCFLKQYDFLGTHFVNCPLLRDTYALPLMNLTAGTFEHIALSDFFRLIHRYPCKLSLSIVSKSMR